MAPGEMCVCVFFSSFYVILNGSVSVWLGKENEDNRSSGECPQIYMVHGRRMAKNKESFGNCLATLGEFTHVRWPLLATAQTKGPRHKQKIHGTHKISTAPAHQLTARTNQLTATATNHGTNTPTDGASTQTRGGSRNSFFRATVLAQFFHFASCSI